MAALKGKGPGRPKGSPNKATKALKDMILGALDKLGGEEYLVKLATETPTAFATLLGKVMPTQVSGPEGGPVQLKVENVIVDSNPQNPPSVQAAPVSKQV